MFVKLEESLITDKSIYSETLRVIAYMKTKPSAAGFRVTEIKSSVHLGEAAWRRASKQLRRLGIMALTRGYGGSRLQYLGVENHLKSINKQTSI